MTTDLCKLVVFLLRKDRSVDGVLAKGSSPGDTPKKVTWQWTVRMWADWRYIFKFVGYSIVMLVFGGVFFCLENTSFYLAIWKIWMNMCPCYGENTDMKDDYVEVVLVLRCFKF